MYISQETLEQTEKRLKEVIRQANFKIHDGAYFFEEFPLEKYNFDRNALAVVRDEEVWSQLIKVSDEKTNKELFKVFSFHFKDGADNSGFFGCLAPPIKTTVAPSSFCV